MVPGEYYLLKKSPIVANAGRDCVRILVCHTGDRPIQVGSHYHFFEVNRALLFDRGEAFGMRLNIAAGAAIRFEPGEKKEVELTTIAGARIVHGANSMVAGELDAPGARDRASARWNESAEETR